MMDCRVTVMDCSETANCTNSSVGVTVSAVFSNGYYWNRRHFLGIREKWWPFSFLISKLASSVRFHAVQSILNFTASNIHRGRCLSFLLRVIRESFPDWFRRPTHDRRRTTGVANGLGHDGCGDRAGRRFKSKSWRDAHHQRWRFNAFAHSRTVWDGTWTDVSWEVRHAPERRPAVWRWTVQHRRMAGFWYTCQQSTNLCQVAVAPLLTWKCCCRDDGCFYSNFLYLRFFYCRASSFFFCFFIRYVILVVLRFHRDGPGFRTADVGRKCERQSFFCTYCNGQKRTA